MVFLNCVYPRGPFSRTGLHDEKDVWVSLCLHPFFPVKELAIFTSNVLSSICFHDYIMKKSFLESGLKLRVGS